MMQATPVSSNCCEQTTRTEKEGRMKKEEKEER